MGNPDGWNEEEHGENCTALTLRNVAGDEKIEEKKDQREETKENWPQLRLL